MKEKDDVQKADHMNTIDPQTEARTKALADALNASGILETSNRTKVIAARNFSKERDFCVTFRDTVTGQELVHAGFPSRAAVWDSIELLGICERAPLSPEQAKLDSMSMEERLTQKNFPSFESLFNPPELTTLQVRKRVPREVLDTLLSLARKLRQEGSLAEYIAELQRNIAAGDRTVMVSRCDCGPVDVKPLMLEIAEEVAAETETAA